MKRLPALLALLLLAGCGPNPRDNAANPDKTDGVIPPIEAYDIVDEKWDDQGDPVWKLSIRHAGVEIDGRHGRGSFDDGKAILYRHRKVAASLGPTSGSYDSASGVLEFKNDVRFESLLYDTEIRANRIEWQSKRDLLVASGGVEVCKGGFYFGKTDLLYADTAGGQFWVETREDRVRNNKILLPVAAVVGVASVYPQDVNYGSISIGPYTSVHASFEQENLLKANFLGEPVRLSAPDQGIEMSTRRLDVTVAVDPSLDGGYRLDQAVATGDFQFKIVRAGADAGALGGRANEAVYDRPASTLRLQGGVALSASGKWMDMRGLATEADNALIRFDPKTNEVLSLDLTSGGKTVRTTLSPDIVLSGYSKVTVTKLGDGKIRAVCDGSPARLRSQEQGFDLRAPHYDVTLATGDNGYALSKADAAGGIAFAFSRIASGDTAGELSGTADRGEYFGDENRLRLVGSVEVEAKGILGAKVIRNRGEEAEIRLEPGTNRLLTLDLSSKEGRGSLEAVGKDKDDH